MSWFILHVDTSAMVT